MRCTDCGHDNREGATFCDSCDAELGVSDVSTAVDSATDISLSPDFVGRHREMAELTAALDDALAGRGRMVMLAGEPGIGKTRLAGQAVFQRRLQAGQLLLAADEGASRRAQTRCWIIGWLRLDHVLVPSAIPQA